MSAATLKRERATLAHDVLASLDGPSDADATQAWETEILRRLDQLETGTAQTTKPKRYCAELTPDYPDGDAFRSRPR